MFGEKLSISRTYSVDNNALILYCDNLHKRMYIESNRITQQNSYPVSCCDFLLVRLNVCVLQYFFVNFKVVTRETVLCTVVSTKFSVGILWPGTRCRSIRATAATIGEGPRAIRRHAVHFMQHCLLDTVVQCTQSAEFTPYNRYWRLGLHNYSLHSLTGTRIYADNKAI